MLNTAEVGAVPWQLKWKDNNLWYFACYQALFIVVSWCMWWFILPIIFNIQIILCLNQGRNTHSSSHPNSITYSVIFYAFQVIRFAQFTAIYRHSTYLQTCVLKYTGTPQKHTMFNVVSKHNYVKIRAKKVKPSNLLWK